MLALSASTSADTPPIRPTSDAPPTGQKPGEHPFDGRQLALQSGGHPFNGQNQGEHPFDGRQPGDEDSLGDTPFDSPRHESRNSTGLPNDKPSNAGIEDGDNRNLSGVPSDGPSNAGADGKDLDDSRSAGMLGPPPEAGNLSQRSLLSDFGFSSQGAHWAPQGKRIDIARYVASPISLFEDDATLGEKTDARIYHMRHNEKRYLQYTVFGFTTVMLLASIGFFIFCINGPRLSAMGRVRSGGSPRDRVRRVSNLICEDLREFYGNDAEGGTKYERLD